MYCGQLWFRLKVYFNFELTRKETYYIDENNLFDRFKTFPSGKNINCVILKGTLPKFLFFDDLKYFLTYFAFDYLSMMFLFKKIKSIIFDKLYALLKKQKQTEVFK